MTDSATIPQLPAPELELRAHARATALQWHVAHRPQGPSPFLARMQAARAAVDKLYSDLDAIPFDPSKGPDPLLEIRENPRLLRSVVIGIMASRKNMLKLPRVVDPTQGDQPRAVALSAAYCEAAHSVWDYRAIRMYVDEVQKVDPLELEELWALPLYFKFSLLELILAQARARLDSPGAAETGPPGLLSARIKSLREIGHTDWLSLAEPLIIFDTYLQQDPANTYSKMDFDSREGYRKKIAETALHSERTEEEVAAEVLKLAQQGQQNQITDPRVYLKRAHVGYYIVDKGFDQLARQVGYHPRLIDRIRMTFSHNADDFFIGGIEILSVLFIAIILLPLVPNYPIFGGLTWAFFLLLLPATQGAVDLINNTVTSIFKARALPKLDFSKGIPREFTTLVAVPTLLMNEKQVRELVRELEMRYLSNPDPNLHFALLTDLPDSVTRPRENDTDPMVDLALELINGLNAEYSSSKAGCFFLLHRRRIFNARQGVWMGWERKRGKLLDLNKYLEGIFDAFPVKAGDLEVLHSVRYIITLDSDTQLPRGTAQNMVGTMAHPLNRAIIDPERRIVTEGYGILQPRVGVSVQSASRSRLASIYSGQTGFDIYTRAISDVYQDLYGEGIFTGKGIYEVSTLHAVLDRRFPRNSLLSHDLIEGAYSRAGLVTDIEVIDDYPSHYSAYTRRKHRWVRGDWQIAQWLLSRVPDESGRYVRNPISTISRWKIFDNLRRSLVNPVTFTLLIAGWLGLPGGALYWTAVTLLLMFIPTLVQLVFSMGHAFTTEQEGAVGEAFSGFLQSVFVTLLNLVFLPHETLLSLDAIIRSLVRRFITGQRLLEWETAAEAESNKARRTPVDRYLAASPAVALLIAALIFAFNTEAILVAAPVLLLWGFASAITVWLNNPPREQKQRLSREEDRFLRQHALRIWRYFYEFGGERHNFLIPDNVEEEGLFEAARVSPTNLGLLLNARQAACEFGFITVPEFAHLSQASLTTFGRLQMYRGHLLNWYNTQTLEPLMPATVSSVDSGNLAASLYTLRTGAASLLRKPLLDHQSFEGLTEVWEMLKQQQGAPAELSRMQLPKATASLGDWLTWVMNAELSATFAAVTQSASLQGEAAWWTSELRTRINAILTLVRNYLPWMLPEFAPLRAMAQLALKDATLPSLEDTPAFINQLEQRLARTWATLNSSPEGSSKDIVLGEQLRGALITAREQVEKLASQIHAVSDEAFRLATEMDFAFLVLEGRQMLSIGYELGPQKLHDAAYDMISSEARIAAFIAIAKGEMPQAGWFKMGRTHTIAFGIPVLLSWTATMFEYLMPSLWMRSYPDTLMSRTLTGVVQIQRAFARQYKIPWGISESGYAQKDDAGHYHYQAFGIPQIALKWDAVAGPVISPYSTFLALGVDSVEALKNLRRMASAGWIGAYGFYEAIDYSQSTQQPGLVREWMAHHQGMALMAILNLLNNDVVKDWFEANSHLQATSLLLHEKPMREAAIRADYNQFTAKKPA